jgi:hypothetical protein
MSSLQVSMIESYLRANKMFVDYSEVYYAYIVLGWLYLKCLKEPGLTESLLCCIAAPSG